MVVRSRKKKSLLRIFLWTVLLTAISGLVRFGEPLDDGLRGARNVVRARPADGQTVVVGLDDRSIEQLGGLTYSEAREAEVVENLLKAGARRVYFDRIFKDIGDKAGAAKFVDVARRYPGRVYLGTVIIPDKFGENEREMGPNEFYLDKVELATLVGAATPFALGAELSWAEQFNGRTVPSVSASMAGKTGQPRSMYRPDWSIQVKTVPTISFIDVHQGRFAANAVAGKDVIIGPMTRRIEDRYRILGQGTVPGVYFHALGAQTLREGDPIYPSWLYPFSVALLLGIGAALVRSPRAVAAIYAAGATLALVAPFVTDAMLITLDYVPAYLLFGIIAWRLSTYRAFDRVHRTNAATEMPNLLALESEKDAAQRPIVALTIHNYADIIAAYDQVPEREILDAITKPITLIDPGVRIFQDDDTLYWIDAHNTDSAIIEHIQGLAKLISSVPLRQKLIDIDFTIGAALDYENAVAERAHAARRVAKSAAKAGEVFAFYRGSNKDEEQWRLSMMSELDKAIDNGEISVVYQPQLNLKRNRIDGAEALVRWTHPVRGPVSPEEFIEQAEATNRIARLTYFVLHRALEDAAEVLKHQEEFRIAVNLSTKMLSDPELPSEVCTALEATGIKAVSLKLEITETATIAESPVAMGNLEALKAIGVQIAIDDYGSGNATLEYLRMIPCSEVKLDRMFVTNLERSIRDRLMVRSTIQLAHSLGYKVTAEGIENEATLALLKDMRCDHAQGFHVGKPVPVGKLVDAVDGPPRQRQRTAI